MNTVYTVAFRNNMFLMVRNKQRGGWEMPGGHIEKGESVKEAAVREFKEESGYSVTVNGIKEAYDCWVCAGTVGERIGEGEMVSEFFSELPECLAFDAKEYEDVIEWAENVAGRSDYI